MMFKTVLLPLSLFSLAASAADMRIYGCTGKNFSGQCQSFTCPYQDCCQLPAFFQQKLVSVKSTGPYNVRLFTSYGCQYHCNDNDNKSILVDGAGWRNIGAAAYACVDGPF